MLEKELETYHKCKAELQANNPDGGFVVIKEESILGVWQTRIDALKYGIAEYGNVEFLIKDINESDFAINFSRNLNFV